MSCSAMTQTGGYRYKRSRSSRSRMRGGSGTNPVLPLQGANYDQAYGGFPFTNPAGGQAAGYGISGVSNNVAASGGWSTQGPNIMKGGTGGVSGYALNGPVDPKLTGPYAGAGLQVPFVQPGGTRTLNDFASGLPKTTSTMLGGSRHRRHVQKGCSLRCRRRHRHTKRRSAVGGRKTHRRRRHMRGGSTASVMFDPEVVGSDPANNSALANTIPVRGAGCAQCV